MSDWVMKNFLCLTAVCCALFVAHQSRAGTEVDGASASVATTEKTEGAVPLDFFQINSGYVFEAPAFPARASEARPRNVRTNSETRTAHFCANKSNVPISRSADTGRDRR